MIMRGLILIISISTESVIRNDNLYDFFMIHGLWELAVYITNPATAIATASAGLCVGAIFIFSYLPVTAELNMRSLIR
jgi:hypothetical protein